MMDKEHNVAGKDPTHEVSLDNPIEKGEIIAYQADEELHIDERIENDTVWLNRQQMSQLFGRDVKTIGKHINNALKEELKDIPTVANFATVQKEGKRNIWRNIEHYNLDVILSVGYRVKSSNGIKFRRWANQVLKDHLLKGYSINQRLLYAEERIDNRLAKQSIFIESHQQSIDDHSTRIAALERQVDFFVKGPKPSKGGIMPANSQWDGFALIAELVKTAEKSVAFIDPFADETALNFAALRKPTVSAIVYTARITTTLQKQAELHNRQYPGLELRNMREVHDRFLLIDDTVYHIGSSFKDIGNKLFGYSILDFVTAAQVMEMVK